jgi:ABC-type arginine transport system permease subunit
MSKLAFLAIVMLIATILTLSVFVSAYASDGSDAANKALETGKKLETSLSITQYQWTNQTNNHRHSIITTTME